MSKKWKRGCIIIAVLALILGGGFFAVKKNERIQLLLSNIYFANHTLKDPSYIAYGLDLMDLFQNYMNGDVSFEGKSHMHGVKGLGFSSSMKLSGARSFAQRKMTCHADMDMLWFAVGEMDFYAQDETIYMVVPMLENMSEAFETGSDLFLKAPEFTSDINGAWFSAHWGDIIKLTTQMGVEKTDRVIKDQIGKRERMSQEYLVTIPRGCGTFIWELLGIESPDHDITVSIYLTPQCHMRRIEMDTDALLSNSKLVVDGENVGTCIFTRELPDDEHFSMTIVKRGDITYTNVSDIAISYETNKGEIFAASMYMEAVPSQDGADISVSDIVVTKNGEETLAKGSFEGSLKKEKAMDDLFAGEEVDFEHMERIQWKEIREDTEGFLNDLMAKAKDNMP